MILLMYSIYDIKAKIYEPPRFCLNEDTAKRTFMIGFQDPKTMYNKFNKDYQVFEIGTFNDESAEINTFPKPTYKWTASDLIRKTEDPNQAQLFEHQNKNNINQEKP